jgi:archaellum component FlaC
MSIGAEKRDLEVHVDLCAERYTNLIKDINKLEDRMERMETMVQDIHARISKLDHKQRDQWDRARDVTIGVLIAVVAWLIQQQLS